MTIAIISGRLTTAFVKDDSGWSVLEYGETVTRPCSEALAQRDLRDCSDAHSLEGSMEDIRLALEQAVDLTEAVDLTLWLLDSDLSDETRISAAEELDEILSVPESRDAWASIFWAKPLTADADIDRAVSLAILSGAQHVHMELVQLRESQNAIGQVCEAQEAERARRISHELKRRYRRQSDPSLGERRLTSPTHLSRASGV